MPPVNLTDYESKNETSTMKKILDGFINNKNELNFKQVLVISHGGWINELFSLIQEYKSLSHDNIFRHANTSISLVRIYCSNCIGFCKSKSDSCRVKIDIVFENNTTHLN